MFIGLTSQFARRQKQVSLTEDPSENDIEFFVKRVQLEYLGKVITSLGSDDNDAFNCVENYMQFQNAVGSTFGDKAINIPYEHYIKYVYVVGFDLSANEESYLTEFDPSRRVGWYQIKIEFSDATTKNLTLIEMCEFPALITVNNEGKVNRSYVK